MPSEKTRVAMATADRAPRPPPDPPLGSDLPPDLFAAIEAESGATLSEFPPELVAHAVDQSRRAGNRAFASGLHREAARLYTQAIAGAPHDRALHANRSAANLALGDVDAALRDAARAVAIDPDWPKAHYRLGRALADAGEWTRASAAFARCVELAPDDSAARERYEAAEYEASDLRARAAAQVAATRRDLASRLRDARRADARADVEAGWRQTMRGPDWDASDLEWRPTYLPMMRARRADRRGFESDPRRAGMLRVAAAAAELDAPKRSLATLDDDARLEAYARAADRHCANRRALCLSGGNAGTLAMCAAAAGASTVVALERNRFLYRSAKLCLKANADAGRVPRDVVRLRDATLDATRLEHLDDRPADVVLTDLIDHAGFGLGLLPAIDRVADAGLAVPDAVFAPSRVVVRAALLRLRVEDVAGFDLRSLNAYRWHPQAAKVDLRREPNRAFLSEPFVACEVDLAERFRRRLARAADVGSGTQSGTGTGPESRSDREDADADEGSGGPATWEHDATIRVPVTSDGVWNAVAFWIDADLGDGDVLGGFGVDDVEERENAPANAGASEGEREGEGEGEGEGGSSVSTTATPTTGAPTAGRRFLAETWSTAVQYLDDLWVDAGETIELRVRRDAHQVFFSSVPAPTRPRTAMIPSWHYDMLNDAGRNDAYDAAIAEAVRARRGPDGARRCVVLDAGSGSGLLSMMASRAGATRAYAVERSAHMTDAGEEAVCLNGHAGIVTCVNRDVRSVLTAETEGLPTVGGRATKPDGGAPEMETKADVAAFEIFDSGLIGEGALHALAAARARLLVPDAALVPAGAVVYAQIVEMRHAEVACGPDPRFRFDLSAANRWRWRPEYEGVDLERRRDRWRPLAPPVEAFRFDFADVTPETLRPDARELVARVDAHGTCNAVAFWFELRLDRRRSLSTSPHDGTKGQTWQQAVQYVEEFEVRPGDHLPLIAKHDTYGISFEVNDAAFPRAERRTGEPLYDPAWAAARERAARANDALARVVAQSPLEFRAAAETAVAAGARPADLGLDVAAGADFCARMMG